MASADAAWMSAHVRSEAVQRRSKTRSSTSMWMARSPRPTLSASSLTIDAISAASYSTRWNSSGETVTRAKSGSLAVGRGLGFTEGAGPGDAARLHHQRFQLARPGCSAVDVRGGADQRLQHHLAIAPVVHLVGEDELEPPD